MRSVAIHSVGLVLALLTAVILLIMGFDYIEEGHGLHPMIACFGAVLCCAAMTWFAQALVDLHAAHVEQRVLMDLRAQGIFIL